MTGPTAGGAAGPVVRGPSGVEIRTYHLGGDGPPLVMLHAAGLHGLCWVPVARSLSGSFSVWAVDQRGHGSSGKAPGGRYDDWGRFVEDLYAVLDAIGGEGWSCVGHSLGGAVGLVAEARRPGTFSRLCCYEPVVVPPSWQAAAAGGRVPLAELARKRRSHFTSRREALANFRSKPPFDRWEPEALDAYVSHGLVDDPDGGVTLACRREDEASVYEGAPGNGAWDLLPSVAIPVTVIGGGDPADPVGRLVEEVAGRIRLGAAQRFADLGHFGPFEDPGRVGAAMERTLLAGPGQSTKRVPPPG